MAAMRAPESIESLRAAHVARRGQSELVTVRLHDALAGPLEGVALVAEVLAAVTRIAFAAANGSHEAVVNEANRLGFRATTAGDEFRRIAGRVDGPLDAA